MSFLFRILISDVPEDPYRVTGIIVETTILDK